DHPVRQRTPASFPSTLQTEITPSPSTSSSESESSSTSRHRPARINYAFHPQQEPYGNVNPEWRISHSQQAKFPTQLIRVLNTLTTCQMDSNLNNATHLFNHHGRTTSLTRIPDYTFLSVRKTKTQLAEPPLPPQFKNSRFTKHPPPQRIHAWMKARPLQFTLFLLHHLLPVRLGKQNPFKNPSTTLNAGKSLQISETPTWVLDY